jgi:hypothetical protein
VIPRVFLSYSHDSEAHKDWVRQLAERLVASGVEVTLDQWDLKPGMDVVLFGETAIREADRVLMVCSPTYVCKAEQRRSGTGQECLIVSAHMARQADTRKFIPLLRHPELQPLPQAQPDQKLIPDFLGPRLWVDFRDDAGFEQSLKELLHDLFEVPRYQKPALGVNPFLGGGKGTGAGLAPTELVLQPQRQVQVEAVEQELGEGSSLRLIRIPAGEFLMGSPLEEENRLDREGPQHKVKLASFFISQTPITQAQWRAVAQWQPRQGERWERELKASPSHFADGADRDQRPVEQVSWLDAMEFCRRPEPTHRTPVHVAQRSPVGIRLPSGNEHAIFFWGHNHTGAGELRRDIHLWQWPQGCVSKADHPCWDVSRERLGSAGHARKRVGMVPG